MDLGRWLQRRTASRPAGQNSLPAYDSLRGANNFVNRLYAESELARRPWWEYVHADAFAAMAHPAAPRACGRCQLWGMTRACALCQKPTCVHSQGTWLEEQEMERQPPAGLLPAGAAVCLCRPCAMRTIQWSMGGVRDAEGFRPEESRPTCTAQAPWRPNPVSPVGASHPHAVQLLRAGPEDPWWWLMVCPHCRLLFWHLVAK